MSDIVKTNYECIIRDAIENGFENSTFEARQAYRNLYNTGKNEFGVGFFTNGSISIGLNQPYDFAFGASHFMTWMEKRGWRFSKRGSDGFEMGDHYNVAPLNYNEGYSRWDLDVSEYESQINLPGQTEALFAELGLIDESGTARPAYQYCAHAGRCWAGMEDRTAPQNHPQWAYPSYPYIGRLYAAKMSRILVLGINTNEGGGLNYNSEIVKDARYWLGEEKQVRVTFGYKFNDGRPYRGSYLWHRMACYARAARKALDCNDDLFSYKDNNEDIQSEYEHFAFMNHVKCSPTGERSKPSRAMWENCGKHILERELEILNPDVVIVLGISDNLYYLEHNVLAGSFKPLGKYGDAQIFSAPLGHKKIGIVVVPHPASQISESIKSDVFEAIYNNKARWRK